MVSEMKATTRAKNYNFLLTHPGPHPTFNLPELFNFIKKSPYIKNNFFRKNLKNEYNNLLLHLNFAN